MQEDLPLIIFVVAVVAISLSYWWYRQKNIKKLFKDRETEEKSKEKE